MNRKNAFSLVELSIVLVILGLLVGGILAGKSLIRASELRAVGTEFTRYKTAMAAFRDKYFYLPGDITNATSFWGAGTCPGTNANTTSPQSTTCNGDGDGMIENWESGSTGNGMFRFWQHLSLAGLIEGSFTGVADSTTFSASDGSFATPNLPASKLANAGWSMQYTAAQDVTSTVRFTGPYGNVFMFGSLFAANMTISGAIQPEEAWNIDTKLDDGKPGTGIIITWENATNCHDTATSNSVDYAATANYRLTNTTNSCALFMRSGF